VPNLTTFPSLEQLEELNSKTPAYMVPNVLPYAAIGEGWLSDKECDNILWEYMDKVAYNFPHCNALTRECSRPLDQVLDPMQNFARKMNDRLWKYDLRSSGAWLQTYEPPNDYQKHMDIVPGQNRKLSAVLMLTDSETYFGGDLGIYSWPDKFYVSRTRGTIVVFQPWLVHFVSPVFKGTRQTINMGFWGPNFR
jgi:hypothetical protein